MGYVDGYVLAVPTKNKQAYMELAQLSARVFKDYGALQVVESWEDPRMNDWDPQAMPFDGKRMIFGGFTMIVED